MTLATTPEHRDLAAAVARFAEKEKLTEAAHRAVVDGPVAYESVWKALCLQGWAALHLPEEYGGAGYTLAESAVVVHGLGCAITPGPLVPSITASAVIAAHGDNELRSRWLPGLADGSVTASVTLAAANELSGADSETDVASGVALGAVGAQLHLIWVDGDVHLHSGLGEVEAALIGLDPGLGCASVTELCGDAREPVVLDGAGPFLVSVARLLASCDAAGGAERTLAIALEHAKNRQQFGRILGGFQAVKHHLADMRIRSELATAAAWGAARLGGRGPEGELTSAVAAALALPAYEANARKSHQLLGGIGFTWEHDAHLFLRRATSWVGLLSAGAATDDDVHRLLGGGVVPNWQIALPEEAEGHRRDFAEFIELYDQELDADRRALLVETGYLVPHWPKPWGRGAGPIEQLVIDERVRELQIPDLDINGWVLLTLVQSATPEQLDRWVLRGLLREAEWCQMFSEPEAGSDAAAVRTKGIRTDGGWTVSGQKMWTTGAHECAWGLATVRTDPAASKHGGLTMMAIDLSAPGVEIRPIREMTGTSTINEVFLDDVFVPDTDVVGGEGNGWKVARATLSNERVSIGGRRALGYQAQDLLPFLEKYRPGEAFLTRALGGLLARELAMQLINVRQVESLLSQVERVDIGAITKVLNSEHQQAVTELGIKIVGVTGAEQRLQYEFLFNRSLTIAGGASEIGRNVVAERILGLPREVQPVASSGGSLRP